MGQVISEALALKTEAGLVYDAHFARPAEGRHPGLIVLTEMWGLTESKREMAVEYAGRGFSVLVPNVFWRSDPSGVIGDTGPDRDRAWDRLKALDIDQVARDVKFSVDWLRRDASCSGKVGAIGFCLGGRLAVLAATRGGVDVAAALYTLGVSDHLDEIAALSGATLQIHYGLADKFVPLSEIETVVRAAAANPNIEIALYPGVGHGFFNPERPAYNAQAVQRAQQSIDRLLSRLKAD